MVFDPAQQHFKNSRRHSYVPPSLTFTLGKYSGARKSPGTLGSGLRTLCKSSPFLYQEILLRGVLCLEIASSVKLHMMTTLELCSTVLLSETETLGISYSEMCIKYKNNNQGVP